MSRNKTGTEPRPSAEVGVPEMNGSLRSARRDPFDWAPIGPSSRCRASCRALTEAVEQMLGEFEIGDQGLRKIDDVQHPLRRAVVEHGSVADALFVPKT
jgi:hypothetical protein